MTDDLIRISAVELAQHVRRREVSPVDLTEQSLERIQALQPSLNAFITVTADSALHR